jgi:hypothetical protein
MVWRWSEAGAENEGSVCSSWSCVRSRACCLDKYCCRFWMCVSWFVRFWVVVVCETRAWARVCGSDVGVERAIVVEASAVRAVEPSGVRCARSVDRIWASFGSMVAYLVSL